jgi:hypothetical protein
MKNSVTKTGNGNIDDLRHHGLQLPVVQCFKVNNTTANVISISSVNEQNFIRLYCLWFPLTLVSH